MPITPILTRLLHYSLAAAPILIGMSSVHAQAADPAASTWGSVSASKDDKGHWQATLENSQIRARYGWFETNGSSNGMMTDFVIKSAGENQVGYMLDCAAGRSTISNAQILEDGPKRKTIRLDFGSPDNRNGQAAEEITIFPDSPVLQIDYVDWFVNIFDIAGPGGAASFGPEGKTQYTFYGGDRWKRPYVPYPQEYFCRDIGEMGTENISEIDDDRPLNYHGWFIMGITSTANGRGYARMIPAHGADVVKLLFRSGFEIFPYFAREHHRLTTYLYAVTGGSKQVVKQGQDLADGRIKEVIPVVATPQIKTDGARSGVFMGNARVELSCGTADAEIHYTLDGKEPTAASPIYSEPLDITQTSHIQAIAVHGGWKTSGIGDRRVVVTAGKQGDWWNTTWRARLPVEIGAGPAERKDKIAEVPLDFGALVTAAGLSGSFDHRSLRVVEVNEHGRMVDGEVPFQWDSDADWNASPKGVLTVFLKGVMAAGAKRHFDVYFDTDEQQLPAVGFKPHVSAYEDVDWAGQKSFKIVTGSATYYYHEQGGGLASMVDKDGNDWISFHPEAGTRAAGEFRGIPNLYTAFHPGYSEATGKPECVSKITRMGPLRTEVHSETKDHKYSATWHFYPDHARLTVNKVDAPYWFCYEGTPAGKFQPDKQFSVISTGLKRSLTETWKEHIAAPRWIYFAQNGLPRSLYFVQHEDVPDAPDQYWPMEGLMTVFGFGRVYIGGPPTLTQTPAHFTIGLTEASDFKPTSAAIDAAYRDLEVVPGAPQHLPAKL